MKRQILIITAMLAVMVAMAGIAGAVGVNTVEDNVLVPYGSSANVHIYWSYGTDHTDKNIRWELREMDDSLTTDLSGSDGDDAGNLGAEKVSYGTTVDGSGVNAFLLTITDVDGSEVTRHYKLYACLATSTGACNMDFVKDVTIPVDAVPEFPTVALPVAAAIGLVFFFSNKKKKEE